MILSMMEVMVPGRAWNILSDRRLRSLHDRLLERRGESLALRLGRVGGVSQVGSIGKWQSNSGTVSASCDSWPEGLDPFTSTPHDVVLEYYDAINNRRLEDAVSLYADNCTHHNLAFSEAAIGKQACTEFVTSFCNNIPTDLKFVVDDISAARSVGVIWHMEVGGMELPLGKGMSFYQIDEKGKISYVRECPEHFAKVASASPLLLRLSAPFLRDITTLPQELSVTVGEELQRAISTVVGSMPSVPSMPLPSILLHEVFSGISQQESSTPQWEISSNSSPAQESLKGGDNVYNASQTTSASPTPRDQMVESLVGTWRRKARLSDNASYNKALNIMGTKGIIRQVAELIDGRAVTHEVGYGQGVRIRFLAQVPGFPELYEDYKFSEWTEMERRDQEPGKQRCRAFMSEENELQLTVELGPSCAWSATDTYQLVSSNELHVRSEVTDPQGETAIVTMLYVRE